MSAKVDYLIMRQKILKVPPNQMVNKFRSKASPHHQKNGQIRGKIQKVSSILCICKRKFTTYRVAGKNHLSFFKIFFTLFKRSTNNLGKAGTPLIRQTRRNI